MPTWNLAKLAKELDERTAVYDIEEELIEFQETLEDDPSFATLSYFFTSFGRAHALHAARAIVKGKARDWAPILRYIRAEALELATRCHEIDVVIAKKKRPEKFTGMADPLEAGYALCVAMAAGMDDIACWIGDRIIRMFTKGDPCVIQRNYESDPFLPFIIRLFARWRGKEEQTIKAGDSAMNRKFTGVNAIWQKTLDAWDDEKQFSRCLVDLCNRQPVFGRLMPYEMMPLEALAIARVRRDQGLPMPAVNHPSVQKNPLGKLPSPAPSLEPDPWYDKVVKLLRELEPKWNLPWLNYAASPAAPAAAAAAPVVKKRKPGRLTEEDLLARWQEMAGDEGLPWDEATLENVNFFGHFRHNGDGLEKSLEGIDRADEIAARIRQIYKAAGNGRGDFAVTKPPPTSPKEAVALLERFFGDVLAMLKAIAPKDAAPLLTPLPKITVVSKSFRASDDELTEFCNDVVVDFMASLGTKERMAGLLHEAIYGMAADPVHPYYVLWPLYRDESKVKDAMDSAFELWTRGLRWRGTKNGVELYVPKT